MLGWVAVLTLMAGTIHAHPFTRIYRHGTVNHIDDFELDPFMTREVSNLTFVDCPVCSHEQMSSCIPVHLPGRSNPRWVKECKYGDFENAVCNNRRDCYRGPSESCNEDKGILCQGALRCQEYECVGVEIKGFYHPSDRNPFYINNHF